MECPICGYLMDPLDTKCPRCARNAGAPPRGPAEPDDGADLAQAPDARHATPITGGRARWGLWVSIVALCGFVLVGAIAIKLTRAPSGAPPAEPQPSEDPAVMQLIASVTEAEQKANEAMQLYKRYKADVDEELSARLRQASETDLDVAGAVVASTSSPASQNMDAALEEATKWQIEWNTRRCKLGLYLVQTGDESGVALLESVYAEPRYVDPDARAAARDALQARGRLP